MTSLLRSAEALIEDLSIEFETGEDKTAAIKLIEAFAKAQRREVWEEAARDLSHGLPEVWKQSLIARCKFKAKEPTP